MIQPITFPGYTGRRQPCKPDRPWTVPKMATHPCPHCGAPAKLSTAEVVGESGERFSRVYLQCRSRVGRGKRSAQCPAWIGALGEPIPAPPVREKQPTHSELRKRAIALAKILGITLRRVGIEMGCEPSTLHCKNRRYGASTYRALLSWIERAEASLAAGGAA